jgi:dienelactone hydrolase
MRLFEIVLLIVNVLSLFLGYKKQSKVVWIGGTTINLAVFIIHAIFEGMRYEMIFSYIFVVLFVVVSLLKTNNTFFKIKKPRPLKITVICFSCLCLLFSGILSYALPVFKLSKPTGNYSIGIKYFHLVDKKRNDPFLDKTAKKRELIVKVYYPAKKDDSKPYAPYFYSKELLRNFAGFYNMPKFLFEHLNLVKTNSKVDLKLSDKEKRYPVILFSHGAGTSMEVHNSQCEDLASHGYIVVAIDHTYVSAATAFQNKVVLQREATTDFNTPEPVNIITQIMADDSKFVIDELEDMNEGKIHSIFKGRLNLKEIGDIGHSVGGAVAYNMANNDSRVKAAMDLDGVVYITPKKYMAPFLMLANDKYHIQAIQKQEPLMKKFDDMSKEEQKTTSDIYGSKEAYMDYYHNALQNVVGLTSILKQSGELFTIEGSDHMKFTDIGFYFGIKKIRELMDIGGKTGPKKTLEITKALTVAFFDQYLKGKSKNSIESLINEYPELRQVKLK